MAQVIPFVTAAASIATAVVPLFNQPKKQEAPALPAPPAVPRFEEAEDTAKADEEARRRRRTQTILSPKNLLDAELTAKKTLLGG